MGAQLRILLTLHGRLTQTIGAVLCIPAIIALVIVSNREDDKQLRRAVEAPTRQPEQT